MLPSLFQPPWPRRLLVAGLVGMVIGALDPLEGSIVILGGTLVAGVGATLAGSRHRRSLHLALALVAIGVGAMWGLSAVGGFGGSTGRTLWWWAAIVPYPVGWVLGLVSAVRALRRPPAPVRT
jgi:hypothetical protein